jgi:RsiW-degrading membrane proteinase PrsW (M82 family)
MTAEGPPSSAVDRGEARGASGGGRRAALRALAGHLLAVSLAVLGGILGILGAAVQEIRSGGLLLLPFIGAPIIEELLKPTGIYIMLVRWPRLLRGQLHTALLAALSGLAFGVVEALVYVKVYVSNPPDWFVTYRFTLPLIVHCAGSFIVGLGINEGLLSWARGSARLPRKTRNLYLAAIGLHAAFNIVTTALVIAGVFGDV